jgi:TonB family protein
MRALAFAVAVCLAWPALDARAFSAEEKGPTCLVSIQLTAMPDAGTYAAVIGSTQPGPVDATATLYTSSQSFSLVLTSVALVDRRNSIGEPLFRTEPVFFKIATTEPIRGGDVSLSKGGERLECLKGRYVQRVAGAYEAPDATRREHDIWKQYVKENPTVLPTTLRPAEREPTCETEYRDATLVTPALPEYPEAARREGAVGTVEVLVALGPEGREAWHAVYRSSGNESLDRAGENAAARSTYAPEIFRCVPVSGGYIYRADFAGR